MALVIPQMNLKSELPGATAQRWRGKPDLGFLGSQVGEFADPHQKPRKLRGALGRGPRDNTRVKGERPGRPHEGGPKQGQDPTAR